MRSYASIETVFVRGEDNKLKFGELRQPEHAAISEWEITEKIDGTNIRVIYTLNSKEIRGRTNKADLPQDLIPVVDASTPTVERAVEYFTEYRGKELHPEWSVTFYGEGYGPGIQKGGRYSNEKRFRCFDVLLGENWWTHGDEMRMICEDLKVPQVPYYGLHLIDWTDLNGKDAVAYFLMDHYYWSPTAREDKGDQEVAAEGIVARPRFSLLNRKGERIMWKLTQREF